MKLAAFRRRAHDPDLAVGLVSDDHQSIRPLQTPPALTERGVLGLLELQARGQPLPAAGPALPLASVVLAAPLPRPRRNLFCVGKNYQAHVAEVARSGLQSLASGDAPSHPIVFSKVPESVVGPGEAIVVPAGVSSAVDYEAELAVVIGRGGKGIRAADALQHVWGYTIVNDVTARDWQNRHTQWHMGKSFDSFCPMGPWLVSADECDGTRTRVRCWVNGELRQDAPTSDMIFGIPQLIETLSAGITLYPGDVIATGTPVGVGIGFQPPKYLQPGDLVRIEVDGIGVLENPVR